MKSQDRIVAKRYARAFMTSEEKDAKTPRRKFDGLVAARKKIDGVLPLLNNPLIPFFVKKEIIEQKISKADRNNAFRFLLTLLEMKRFYLLDYVIERAKDILYSELGIERVLVSTPKKLGDNSLSKIEDFFKKETKKKIELNVREDETLIGGLQFEFDGKFMDRSLKGKFEDLKEKILNR
jgi:F-type H+-transporting ATPase subunit delta